MITPREAAVATVAEAFARVQNLPEPDSKEFDAAKIAVRALQDQPAILQALAEGDPR